MAEPEAERGAADVSRAGRPGLTVADLERWEDGGAIWRAIDVDDHYAVVELCTCVGEPVDQLVGDTPELVAYVRARGLASDHG